MKNPILSFVLAALFLSATIAQAQQTSMSWKKHVKMADELYQKAEYEAAGEHYRNAFKQKTKRKDLAYKAGLCFFNARDYRNAADAWQHIKDGYAPDPLVRLNYARCLKQDGQFEAASSEFVRFLSSYKGEDKGAINQMVQTELRGCELAAELTRLGDDPNIILEHLGPNVNTPETEFGPIAFSDEALYFSSTMAKRAEIYRSLRSPGTNWGKASPIDKFPAIEGDHFCNGTLTPDASRFYFTVCKSDEKWGGLTTYCQIYVTRHVGKVWTTPERLPDYINEQNVSTTQPFVVQNGNTEILYFASNRSGGMGGMDIWYTTREVSSNANDFTLPINAGSRINTKRDEITPFFDTMEGRLYFASNGHQSIGGFDIFRSMGAKSHWTNAENVGTPINSPADDFSFVKMPSGKGGFIVSNRTYGQEKISTTHEDIFEFRYETPTVLYSAKGEVYSKASRDVLTDVEVTLYELDNDGQRRFVNKTVSSNGRYDFRVEPSRRYLLEASKEGFFHATYDFDTREFDTYTDFGAPLYLEPYGVGSSEDGDEAIVKEDAKKPLPTQPARKEAEGPKAKPNPAPKQPVAEAKPAAPTKTTTATSPAKAAPLTTGTYYKIQIIALAKVDLNHPRFGKVKNMRRIDQEFFADRKLYRVMLADYATLEEAKAELPGIRAMKDFGTAFIVEYKDGVRGSTVMD